MKKKLLCMALSMGLIAGSASTAFGATAAPTVDTTIPPAENATMEFSGTPISLSLKDTITKMKTEGTTAETIELARTQLELYSKSSSEAMSTLKEGRKEAQAYADAGVRVVIPSLTDPTAKSIELAKNYFKQAAVVSYAAAMKNVESNATKIYYGILQAQEGYRIAGEAVKLSQTTYDHAKLKLNLGTVTKKDVLEAHNGLLTAQAEQAAALTGVKTAKMAFNTAMGYNVMQAVTFTDSLATGESKEAMLPLTDAINSAYENRAEIMNAKYTWQNAELSLAGVNAYPRDSAKYLTAQFDFNSAKEDYKTTVSGIEQEVRTLYMQVTDAKNDLTTARAAYENAQETARLAKLQYDAGLCTMTDLQGAQTAQYGAQLKVSSAITTYDLALFAYNNSPYLGSSSGGSASGSSGGQAAEEAE